MSAADPFSLEGRVVVVTGAAGQLGSQYAATLLSAGANVAGLDLEGAWSVVPSALEPYAADDRLLFLEADITDRGQLEQALSSITSRLGEPAGLVNNAGIDAPPNAPAEVTGPFETYPLNVLHDVLQANVVGVFLCCQVFGGAMATAGRGSIINISSIYGVRSPDQRLYEYRHVEGTQFFKPAAYSVSKSALTNLTRYLATYWGGSGVRVNTLVLGGVYRGQDPRFVAAYEARVPLGRMASEDDYTHIVQFLLSDASRYMTGSNVVADGGWTAW